MSLPAGVFLVAQKLHEAMGDLSASDLCKWLCDALKEVEGWAYYVDHIGDNESGDVIFSQAGDLKSAPYEIDAAAGRASIDMEQAVDVLPQTSYVPEADEGEHYASMEAAKLYLPGTAKYVERFVSKGEREKADSGSFAGKGKSYPILKPEDVKAAASSLGRAGSDNYSTDVIKRNIIKIAKRKGWTKYLPKAWQGGGDDNEESRRDGNRTGLALCESAATLEPIVLREARADYEIKLIAPGKGSSAFYPAEVLKRDGPKVFTAGTHVYLNHPTAAEESARPEGDVANLAGVLTTNAAYSESHAKGAGLYARMKVFADHATMVEEKAPHVGMSIRASGVAESGKKQDGLPILKELTSAESVDVVTRAGAGGMILTEAARPQEGELTLEEAQKLVKEAVKIATAPLIEAGRKTSAKEEAEAILESVTLPDQAKKRIIARCIETLPLKDGALDLDKFRELVVKEAKAEGEYLASVTGSGRVIGMGAAAPVQLTEAQAEEQRKAEKRRRKEAKRGLRESADIFADLGLPANAAKLAAGGRLEPEEEDAA